MLKRTVTRIAALLAIALVCLIAPVADADAPRPDGRTWAVLVGVADYPDSPLPRTDVDAARIGQALSRHLPADRLHMEVLLNRDATRQNVERALAEVAQNATERDEVVFFFSGHGGTEPDQANGDEGDGVDETIVLFDGSLRDDELAAMLAPIKSRMAIVALDSCFSGGFLFDVGNERGRMAMFSSDEDLTSAVPSEEAGGWLSLYLAEALEGRADGAADGVAGQALDGALTALEIEMYIRDRFATNQRIEASDPRDRTVGYQLFDIKRVGVAPDAIFMNLGGEVPGGVRREVLVEEPRLSLPGSMAFAALPRVTLDLEAGRTYVVETYDLGPSTDTVLELRRMLGAAPDERDPVLAENDDAGGSLASRIEHTPTASGRYYALVRPYAEQTGGSFGLRALSLTAGPDAPRTVTVAERAGVALPGTADFAALPTLELTLEAGHTYTVETFDLAGSTDTVLELRRAMSGAPSPSDPVLAQNDDAGGSLASRVRWAADASGPYYAIVRPYAPETGGTFSIRATEQAAPGASPSPVAPSPGAPTPPAPSAGAMERRGITLPGAMDFAALPAIEVPLEVGRSYRIETFELAGDTDTVIELRRALDGAPSSSDPVIAENDDDGESLASRIEHTVSEPGTYYVLVRPYAPQTGGTFGLRVSAR